MHSSRCSSTKSCWGLFDSPLIRLIIIFLGLHIGHSLRLFFRSVAAHIKIDRLNTSRVSRVLLVLVLVWIYLDLVVCKVYCKVSHCDIWRNPPLESLSHIKTVKSPYTTAYLFTPPPDALARKTMAARKLNVLVYTGK